jgi:hypothetical protein
MTAQDRLSIEFLRECFEYRDGVLYWRERPAHHFKRPADHLTFLKKSAGKPAGRSEPKGYLCVKMRIDGHPICPSVHRIVWAMHHGKWPEHTIDHIDRNKSNNRIENLRDVTMSENLMNRGHANSTGISGVHRNHDKYSSQLRIGDRYVHLGTFENTDDAHRARLIAESAALAAIQKPQQAPMLHLSVRSMSVPNSQG